MMTAEEPQVKPEPAPEVAPEGASETPVQPEAAEAPAQAAEPAEPENPLAAELAAAKERYLRLLADMDNMRKRQTRELEERTARANERLLTALLPVFDHFEMALAAAPADDAFAQGVQMIAGEFRKVLENSGAEVIDAPEGTAFDPMAHEALTTAPHATIPQGSVVSQFRKGWKLGGKVVRPAQVIVSAGAPAAPAEEKHEEA
ncbi:MAG: nucleotide exchange factor GrpE [Candidatus Spyradenecus sp.]